MPGNFNFIAPIYDPLAFLVYGNNLIDAKKIFFEKIPSHARLLLMGGGTGNILNDLLKKKPDIIVDFVEASSGMMKIATKNLKKEFQPRVNFITGDHHSIPKDVQYDVITSFFVIDCFKQQDAVEFARAITSVLKHDGIWLFTDFFGTGKFYHRVLLWSMYRFFRVVSRIPTIKLPDYAAIFKEVKFTVREEKRFLNGLIRSLLLERE